MNVYYPITELTQLADELSLIADRIENTDSGLLEIYGRLVREVSIAARAYNIPLEISFQTRSGSTLKVSEHERHYGWHENYHRPGST